METGHESGNNKSLLRDLLASDQLTPHVPHRMPLQELNESPIWRRSPVSTYRRGTWSPNSQ